MSLSRVKTWNPGDVLTASDLNGEFNNVLNNPISLVSPTTGPINFNLQAHTNMPLSVLSASSGSTGNALVVSSTGGIVMGTAIRILQLVAGSAVGPVTATTTSFADTGISIAITPASTNSRIGVNFCVNSVVPATAGANNFMQVQVVTSSGTVGTAHIAETPSGAGGQGIDSDMAWTFLYGPSTAAAPLNFKLQFLESSAGVNPTLNNFQGYMVEYSS